MSKEKVAVICKNCCKTFKVIYSRRDRAKFCDKVCSNEFYKTSIGKLERSERVKKDWSTEKGLLRRQSLSKRMKKLYTDIPEQKKQSIKNLSIVHKKQAAGIQVCFHTEKFKQELSERSKLPRSDKTKQKVKENHWSTSKKREQIIKATREKVWGDPVKTKLIKAKQSKVKAEKIASGEIKLLFGKSGSYKGVKSLSVTERYDSLYELFVMQELDKDNTVLSWTKNHKIVIPYIFNGEKKNYVPDFLIKKQDCTILKEIKSSWSNNLYPEINLLKKEAGEVFSKAKSYEFIWEILILNYKQIKRLNDNRNKTS